MSIIYKGLGMLFKLVYDLVSSTGLEPESFSYFAQAIILTTILIKVILLPLQLHANKKMKKTQELQPLVKEIQTKYKNDQKTATEKIQQLYKDNNASMAGGCLPMLIQLPILMAFFGILRDPSTYIFTTPGFYESMSKTFFWIKDLTLADPYWYGLPVLTGLTTYLTGLTTPKVGGDKQAEATTKTMNYIMPVVIFTSSRRFSAGLALYWTVSSIFSVVQQYFTNRSLFVKGDKK